MCGTICHQMLLISVRYAHLNGQLSGRPLSILEMFLALVILFYIVLLYVLGILGCVYVWTVVSAGYPALLFQLIVLCSCVWFVLRG